MPLFIRYVKGFIRLNRATSGLLEISTLRIAKGQPPLILIEQGPPNCPYDSCALGG